jgi:hypothetical protein
LCDGALDKCQAKINIFLRVYKLREREFYIVANPSKVAMTGLGHGVSSVGSRPTTNNYRMIAATTTTPTTPTSPIATFDVFDMLENELVATVRKYKGAIRAAYRNVRDPQGIDAALDNAIATVIRELEDAGYHFDTGALDNVLNALNRKLNADEWEVIEEEVR